MMLIMSIVSNIVNININQLLANSLPEDTGAEWLLEHLGEQGQNIDLHQPSPSLSAELCAQLPLL